MNPRSLYGTALGFALLTFVVIALRFDSLPSEIPAHIGPDGEVNRWVPTTLLSATFGAWYSLLLLALLRFATPHPNIAYRRLPVSPASPIPYSETAAEKAAALLRITERSLAWIAVSIVVPLCLLQVTMTFPEYERFTTPALILISVSAFAAVVYTFVLIARWPKQMKEMPTDEAETARKHFGAGSGMGFYNEPADPMAVWISPFNESKVDLNWAHPPVKKYVYTMGVLLLLVCVAPFLLV